MFRFLRSYLLHYWGSVHRYVGHITKDPQNYARAAAFFGRAYAVDPSFERAKLDQGLLWWRELRDPQAALKAFDQLLAGEEPYPPALFNRGMLRQELGDYPEAIGDLQAYLRLSAEDSYYEDVAAETIAALQDILDDIEPPAAQG